MHAQQAAETSLKAVLVLHDLPAPFTHDLAQGVSEMFCLVACPHQRFTHRAVPPRSYEADRTPLGCGAERHVQEAFNIGATKNLPLWAELHVTPGNPSARRSCNMQTASRRRDGLTSFPGRSP